MNEYKLIDYFDVFGNEEDGWIVNDLCDTGHNITIDDNASDEDIINLLIQINYLNQKANLETIHLEWWDEFVCELFETETDMPLGRLVRKEINYESK